MSLSWPQLTEATAVPVPEKLCRNITLETTVSGSAVSPTGRTEIIWMLATVPTRGAIQCLLVDDLAQGDGFARHRDTKLPFPANVHAQGFKAACRHLHCAPGVDGTRHGQGPGHFQPGY